MNRVRSHSRLLVLCALVAGLLGASAPLAHAHLDAASAASDLCGEHHGEVPVSAGDTCSLCLAGGLARIAAPAAAAVVRTAARPDTAIAAPVPDLPAAPGLERSRPRAPPAA